MNIISKRQIKRDAKNYQKKLYKQQKELLKIPKLINDISSFDDNKSYDNVDGCGIVLLKNIENKYYILLRLCNNIYYIPKGYKKTNESILDGSIRELERYTKITSDKYEIDLDHLIKINYIAYCHMNSDRRGSYFNKHMHFFLAYAKQNILSIANNQYGSYHWVQIDKIIHNDHYEKNLKIVLDYIRDNVIIYNMNKE